MGGFCPPEKMSNSTMVEILLSCAVKFYGDILRTSRETWNDVWGGLWTSAEQDELMFWRMAQ
jgi:hypothetical protein